jgi:hypothetical protein
MATTTYTWWKHPLWALLGLVIIGGIDSWLLGVSSLALDSCPLPPTPCRTTREIDRNFHAGAIVTAILFATLLLPLRDQRWRPLRHALIVATLLAAAWPIIWIVLLGGPTL